MSRPLSDFLPYSETELYTDTDKVFAGFCSACVAAPDSCVLARDYTASQLSQAIFSFLDNLKYNPIPVSIPGGGFLLEYSLVKSTIAIMLYDPVTWPMYATVLDSLLTGNMSAIVEYNTRIGLGALMLGDEAMPGIKCSDKFSRASDIADVLPDINARHQLSRIVGDTADHVVMRCAQWRMAAKERYGGDFQVRTKNPILLIGNSFDPVTPLVSARNVSSGFEGSVVLQHDAYGVRSSLPLGCIFLVH